MENKMIFNNECGLIGYNTLSFIEIALANEHINALNDVESLTNYLLDTDNIIEESNVDWFIEKISEKPFAHILTVRLAEHLKTAMHNRSKYIGEDIYRNRLRLNSLLRINIGLCKLNSARIPNTYLGDLALSLMFVGLDLCFMIPTHTKRIIAKVEIIKGRRRVEPTFLHGSGNGELFIIER